MSGISISIDRLWGPRNRTIVLIASASLIVLIALVDWWTLPYVSLGYLYLAPILLAAGFLPRPALVLIGVTCAFLSEVFSSLDSTGRVSRLIFEALALSGSGLFTAELLRNRRLTLLTRARLRALVETSPAAIVTVDPDGFIDSANRAACEMLASPEGSVVGQSIGHFVPDLGNAIGLAEYPLFRTSMQCAARRADGEAFKAEVWFSTYRESGATNLAAIVADITGERAEPETQCPVVDGPDSMRSPTLNERQAAILRLVLEGNTNRAIAAQLDVSDSAVKNTLQQLFHKTGVNSRSQLVGAVLSRYKHLLQPTLPAIQSNGWGRRSASEKRPGS